MFENTSLAVTVAFTRQIHESPLTDKAALFFLEKCSQNFLEKITSVFGDLIRTGRHSIARKRGSFKSGEAFSLRMEI